MYNVIIVCVKGNGTINRAGEEAADRGSGERRGERREESGGTGIFG